MKHEQGSQAQPPGFETTTLWRVSAYGRAQESDAQLGASRAAAQTQLSTTLQADLGRLRQRGEEGDVLEVLAAFMRQRESGLLLLAHDAFVWPVTVFPEQGLYHSPMPPPALTAGTTLAGLRLLSAERPRVRPPGHLMQERVAALERYRPLPPLLWLLALHGPRGQLLDEIGGRAAYRAIRPRAAEMPAAPGALWPAVQRLQAQAASLREVSRWPGMGVERASRLLNALYLGGALIVTRMHPAAREVPSRWSRLFRGTR